MTLENMQEFIVLAEEHNYQIAADRLYTTQATLSRHIIALEEELGIQLLNRSTKKIELTEAGVTFLSYAHKAAQLQIAMQKELEKKHRQLRGTLTVGYNGRVSFYNFTDLLGRFMAQYPGLNIEVIENEPPQLLTALRDKELDVAIVLENPFTDISTGLKRIRIASDEMIAVLPQGHPLESRDSITLPMLKHEKFITSSIKKEPGSIFLEACRRAGFEPILAHTGIIGSAAFELVKNTRYVSLDWSATVKTYFKGGVSLVEVEPKVRTYVDVLYLPEGKKPGKKMLLKYFKSHEIVEGSE
ncbi:MAG: LysR family transcriptional regulator [Firmicutes bacterium]|nr:LysR family transcriptional regulator [Bacillota bacterium]